MNPPPTHRSFPLAALAVGAAAVLGTGCASHVADLDGPGFRQKLNKPAPVEVTLNRWADLASFRAQVNGDDVTDAFAFSAHGTTNTGVLTDYVFEPAPPRQPHVLVVAAEPGLNAEGQPMGGGELDHDAGPAVAGEVD
ncbi:MAG: hypothetical protein AAFX76_04190, partial [Planctomycetota bacterium]